MNNTAQFPYVAVKNARGETALRPLIPVRLVYGSTTVEATGLIDSGADVNVLPYNLGVALGGNWELARRGLRLSGNLARYEARGILVSCTVGVLASVQLAFAWTQAEDVPLLFGQVNFLAEFDVCFFRARGIFEVRPKSLS
ncbi:MAG: hypothetical protein JNJ61_05070 [Anaerolineae bacterium]|nr:hypothetical protein [Anaerolineae bacterium]